MALCPRAQVSVERATLGHRPTNISNRNAVAAIPLPSRARDVRHNVFRERVGSQLHTLANTRRTAREVVEALREWPWWAWPLVARDTDDTFTRGNIGPAEMSQSASSSTAFINQLLVAALVVINRMPFIFHPGSAWPALP